MQIQVLLRIYDVNENDQYPYGIAVLTLKRCGGDLYWSFYTSEYGKSYQQAIRCLEDKYQSLPLLSFVLRRRSISGIHPPFHESQLESLITNADLLQLKEEDVQYIDQG